MFVEVLLIVLCHIMSLTVLIKFKVPLSCVFFVCVCVLSFILSLYSDSGGPYLVILEPLGNECGNEKTCIIYHSTALIF